MNASTKTVPEGEAVGQGEAQGSAASLSPVLYFCFSRASAISSNFITLFQLRAVPRVVQILSTLAQGSFDFPAPLGK